MNARIPEPCLCGATDCRACHGAMAVPDELGDDRTLDALQIMRDLINDAERHYSKGERDKWEACLRALMDELS